MTKSVKRIDPANLNLKEQVVAINREEVVFKQIVNDPSIIKPFREVVKKLNPEP